MGSSTLRHTAASAQYYCLPDRVVCGRANISAGCAASPPVGSNPSNLTFALCAAAIQAQTRFKKDRQTQTLVAVLSIPGINAGAFRTITVNSSMMTSSRKQCSTELHSALRAARENENRWLGLNAEYATDGEAMEQWANTARLRRLEVERIEALLAQAEEL